MDESMCEKVKKKKGGKVCNKLYQQAASNDFLCPSSPPHVFLSAP